LGLQFANYLPEYRDLHFDDDVSACFRQRKYNPNVISAKAYTIEKHLFVPTGNTFGDCSSVPSWEPFAKARMALATQLSRGLQFVTEYATYLDQVVFAPPPLPGTKFAQARPDRFNPGVPIPFDGTLPAAPFPMHVDYCLYASAGPSWMR
jgi:hypothetical protein